MLGCSQAMTAAPVRPSRCPSRPCSPARSTNPVSHGSTRTHRPCRRSTPTWVSRGGSRRCRAPGPVPARPAPLRRARRRRGARSATTRGARRRPRPPSGPHPRSPRRSGCATGGWSAPAPDLGDGLGERAALAVVLPASPASLVPPHHDSVLTVGDVFRRGGLFPLPPPQGTPPPPGPTTPPLNTNTRQPEQICRSVGHAPWPFFLV